MEEKIVTVFMATSESVAAPSRCPHCAGPLSKDMETSSWTVAPFLRDSFSMIGSAVGGTASAFYGFNHSMPVVRRWIKGPMCTHFLIGAPPVIVFSSACAGLAGGCSASCGPIGFLFLPRLLCLFIAAR